MLVLTGQFVFRALVVVYPLPMPVQRDQADGPGALLDRVADLPSRLDNHRLTFCFFLRPA
jgi:hypothetical protein